MRNPLKLFWFFWVSNMIFMGIAHYSIEVSGQCLEDQKSLLLQFKQGLPIYSNESKLASWFSTTDCCSWDGVTCDYHTGRVIGLDLSNSSIYDGINSSSSLFGLLHLQQLNLAYNGFYPSPFPSGFHRLSSLTHLNLSYAGFAGQVPLEISFLTKLVSLDLSCLFGYPMKLENPDLKMLIKNFNELTELHLDGVNISMIGSEWPQVLSSALPNLRVLSLSLCDLTGPIHPSLSQLRFLTHLNLDGNNLTSLVPDFLANLSLTSLQLSFCNLHGLFPEAIFLMPTLRALDISDNPRLTGSLPEFPRSSTLQAIKLSNTYFSGELPVSISNLQFLRSLELDECRFHGLIPSSFEYLGELVYLDISRNNFSGAIPSLASSKEIIHLALSHNGFTGTIPLSYSSDLRNLETLNLQNNSLQGMIPSSLFSIPSIKSLILSHNRFSGQLPEFQNASSSFLMVIDLSQNELHGSIPTSIFKITSLVELLLPSNHFNGTIDIGMFKDLKYLGALDVSENNLYFNVSGGDSTTLSQIETLRLSSCNIEEFPNFLKNQIYLFHLDLSNNRISGEIPTWLWELGKGNLAHLNLSHNMLHGFEQPGPNLSSVQLAILDLHSNVLQGSFLVPPPSIVYLDYSNNKFTSTLPSDIKDFMYFAIFISLSSNNLGGEIPLSLCKTKYLKVLDLSNNHFNGSIPPCLGSNSSLMVLKLKNNELHGMLPQSFEEGCSLRTLDLNQNRLEGPLPRTLIKCRSLEVLDLGSNYLNGSFPFWLEELPELRVLVLRSNNFGNSMELPQDGGRGFTMLQIIDLSSNNFKGKLPNEWFHSLKAMMKWEKEYRRYQVLGFHVMELSDLNYQDSVTMTVKGIEMEFIKILTIYTSIDFSNNQFEGDIPEVVGDLESLYALKMSRNNLTGQIPSTFGNLKALESLDISQNKLSGRIPEQLVGEIPRGHQFETFSDTSFEGNCGLCGPPLSNMCRDSLLPVGPSAANNEVDSSSGDGIDWKFFWNGFGCGEATGVVAGLMLGHVIGNVVLKKRGRIAMHRNIRQW